MQHEAKKLLQDIQEAGAAIQGFIHGSDLDRYAGDDLLRSAVERKFITIGEAISRLLLTDAALVVHITDYRKIIDFRHVLVHGYSKIDDLIVWDAAEHYLPTLLADVEQLLASA